MTWPSSRFVREWLLRLWGSLARRRTDSDLQQELASHLALAAEYGQRAADRDTLRAADPTAARTAQAMDALRDQRGLPWLDDLARDIRHGTRSLRRTPLLAIAFVLVLGFGIGANTAVFQLLDAIQLRALPVQEPGQLAIIELADLTRWKGRRTSRYPALSNPLWEQLRERQAMFSGVFAWANGELRFGDAIDSTPVRGLFVSGEFFTVLGVPATAGRTLTTADDRPGCGTPAAVVSDAFWRRHLHADRSAIGRPITLGGQRVDVVGVTSPAFTGVEIGSTYDVALPICSFATLGREEGWLSDGNVWWLTVMGRMPTGHELASVNTRLRDTSRDLFHATVPPNASTDDAADYRGLRLHAIPGGTGLSVVRNQFREPLTLLLVLTAMVLLIACTNLATLVLTRGAARARELAVRVAIGASRGRLIRQVMTEYALLTATAAVTGVALARVMSRVLIGFLGPNVTVDVRTDVRTVAFVIVVSMVAWLTFGLMPTWLLSGARVATALKGAGARGTATASGSVVRQGLVSLQVAISMVLVVGAFLFAGTLRNLLLVDDGFQGDGVEIARIDFRRATVSPSDRAAFKRDVLERMRHVAGVAAAAEVRHVPLSGTGSSAAVWLDGADPATRKTIRLNGTSEGYVGAMGIRLIAGRDFLAGDSPDAPRVAQINVALARLLGIAGNPVGTRLRMPGPGGDGVVEVVGLVSDTKHFTLREEFQPMAYVPLAQVGDPRPFADYVIRTSTTAGDVALRLRRALAPLGPFVTVDVRSLTGDLDLALVRERLLAALSVFFGLLAAILATIGLYGLMADVVSRRTAEIGLRMALGAARHDILAIVVAAAARLLVVGLIAGAGLAYAVASLARSLVFGMDPRGMTPIALAATFLTITAGLAILWPAYRAAGLNPLAALRED